MSSYSRQIGTFIERDRNVSVKMSSARTYASIRTVFPYVQNTYSSLLSKQEKFLNKAISIPELVALFLVSKIVYYGIFFVVTIAHIQGLKTGGLCQWDCKWYVQIAQHGYDKYAPKVGIPNWGYFPLVPYLAKIISAIVGLSLINSGILLSNFAFLIFLIGLRKLLQKDYEAKVTNITLMLCLATPINIYFNTFYTESCYVALVVWSLVFLRENKWVSAGISIGAVTVTRGTGFFLISYFVWCAIRSPATSAERKKVVLGMILATTALFTFSLYMFFHTGNALAYYSASNTTHMTLLRILDWPYRWIRSNSLTEILDLLVVSCGYFVIARAVLLKRIEEIVLLLPICIITPAAIFNFRYLLSLYPFYLYGAWMLKSRMKLIFPVLVFTFALQIVAEILWLKGAPYLV
jgi:hypothetical protein